MSEVYQTDFGGWRWRLAVPIRDLDGSVIGIIVSVQRLEITPPVAAPDPDPRGGVFVVDRKGQLVFHPTRVAGRTWRTTSTCPWFAVLEGGDGWPS